jgi:hypothetical protein
MRQRTAWHHAPPCERPANLPSPMDLKLPITIHDEMEDQIIVAKGVLDLASGDITQVVYVDHDLQADGFPAEREDYDFTCGVLANGSKEVEFRIDVNVVGRSYSITPSELLELKGRAAKLFAAPPAAAKKTQAG